MKKNFNKLSLYASAALLGFSLTTAPVNAMDEDGEDAASQGCWPRTKRALKICWPIFKGVTNAALSIADDATDDKNKTVNGMQKGMEIADGFLDGIIGDDEEKSAEEPATEAKPEAAVVTKPVVVEVTTSEEEDLVAKIMGDPKAKAATPKKRSARKGRKSGRKSAMRVKGKARAHKKRTRRRKGS